MGKLRRIQQQQQKKKKKKKKKTRKVFKGQGCPRLKHLSMQTANAGRGRRQTGVIVRNLGSVDSNLTAF